MRDRCDLAYVLLVARVERQYLADRTALVTAALISGSEHEPSSLEDALADFDMALNAEPERLSAKDLDNRALLRAVTA